MARAPVKSFPIEFIRRRLSYDEATGVLTWRERPLEDFGGSVWRMQRWNLRYAGAEAGSPRNGYLKITISVGADQQNVLAHRVAWAIAYGTWPKGDIDHINHRQSDNRLANLRDVPPAENFRNTSMRRHNTTGVTGVVCVASGKWQARIGSGKANKSVSIGTFASLEEAAAARKKAERRLGFHPNHGIERRPALAADGFED